MSTAVKHVNTDDWNYLYAAALKDDTSRTASERICRAEKAIVKRMAQLRGCSRESAEWRAILEALSTLYTLKRGKLMSWFAQPDSAPFCAPSNGTSPAQTNPAKAS